MNETMTHAADPGMEDTAPSEQQLQAELQTMRVEVVGLRDTIRRQTENLATLRNANDMLQQWQHGVGEALRDEAIRRDWCSEYDSFAEEWDLPKRYLNFEVTMTITVTASDEESALEMVRDSVSLSQYSEGVHEGPDFEASEA